VGCTIQGLAMDRCESPSFSAPCTVRSILAAARQHGHPDDGKVVSAPGALLNGVSIFVTVNAAAVTKNAPKERDHKVRGEGHSKSAAGADEAGPRSARFGVLYERWWSSVQSKWIWINHGNPPADGPILPVSPVDLHDGSVFCLLQVATFACSTHDHPASELAVAVCY
jgi:hypothetical protein